MGHLFVPKLNPFPMGSQDALNHSATNLASHLARLMPLIRPSAG
jgi:hypothetical protein